MTDDSNLNRLVSAAWEVLSCLIGAKVTTEAKLTNLREALAPYRAVLDVREECRAKLDMWRCRATVVNIIKKGLGVGYVPSDEYVGLVAEVDYLRSALAIYADTQDEIERALSPVGWGDKALDGTGTGLVNGGDPSVRREQLRRFCEEDEW